MPIIINEFKLNNLIGSCCNEKNELDLSKNQSRLLPLILGTGVAILSSLCCWTPLVAVAFGISGVLALSATGKFQIYFLLASVALFVFGVYYFLHNNNNFNSKAGFKYRTILFQLIATLLVFISVNMLIKQFFIPLLSSKTAVIKIKCCN